VDEGQRAKDYATVIGRMQAAAKPASAQAVMVDAVKAGSRGEPYTPPADPTPEHRRAGKQGG
jgi:hypothetical protein